MGWIPRIPEIKKSLALNDGQFGLLLLASSLGAVMGAQLAGRLIHTFGSRRLLRFSTTIMSAAIIFIGISHSSMVIALSLFCMGVGYSSVDVSSNTQAVGLERIINKRVMVSFHGGWSLGSLVVSLLGSFAIKHGISPEKEFISLGVVSFVAFHISTFFLLEREHDDRPQKESDEVTKAKIPLFNRSVIPLWWLGIGAIASIIPEGAVSDWGGILLHENYHLSKVVASTAFGTFAVAMIISRFSGDHFLHLWGAEKILRRGGFLAGFGMVTGILIARFTFHSHPALALIIVDIGFFCAGLGIGPMFPTFMLAAGAVEGIPTAVAISRVGVIAISSYFLGPSVIGGLAQLLTLPYAFLYPVGLLIFLGFTAHKMVPRPKSAE